MNIDIYIESETSEIEDNERDRFRFVERDRKPAFPEYFSFFWGDIIQRNQNIEESFVQDAYSNFPTTEILFVRKSFIYFVFVHYQDYNIPSNTIPFLVDSI